MNATIAIFDLDGTITWRDTYVAYLLHVLPRRPARVLNCLGLPLTVIQFKLGRITNDEIKRAFLKRIIGNCTRAEVERFTAEFVAHRFVKMAKPRALARIDWHRRQGHLLVLATASFDFYAEAIGRLLGFDYTVATRAVWYDERLTGELDGENLRGEAKLTAVARVLTSLDRAPSRIIVYSDNQTDLPILRFADHGIAIDPTPRLAAAAETYGLATEIWNGKPTDGGDVGPQFGIRKKTQQSVIHGVDVGIQFVRSAHDNNIGGGN
jgi:phosphatidylglycerophosphatase C